jgi:hypothetical protein
MTLGMWLFVFYVTLHKAKLQPAMASIMDRSPRLQSL